jgi:5-formyltetrahydrofolate cyclo-ligase
LSRHRARRTIRAIGIAYAGQRLDEIPHEDTDERLDAVVTEEGVIRFERD